MRTGPHSHPCASCKEPVECCGAIEQNFDGWPEFICVEYHLHGGGGLDVYCDACQQAEDVPTSDDDQEAA
jgi:hypothetical protein